MMIRRTFFFIPVEAGAMPTNLVRHGGTSADCADFGGLQWDFWFDELERVEAPATLFVRSACETSWKHGSFGCHAK